MFNIGCSMFFLLMALGCSKTADPQPGTRNSTLDPRPSTPVLRLHWLGKQRLAAESNATNFMSLWNLPESAKLEAQTLDKLSTAPWRLLTTPTPLSNAPAARLRPRLRPLLDDLVQRESYLEIHGNTNQPGELVFAIRLDSTRAALWHSNLPLVLRSLFPSQTPDPKPQTPDPDFRLQTSDFRLQLTRSGDWTLLALSDLRLQASDSGLLTAFKTRIQRDGAPFAKRATNYWLDVETAAPRLSKSLRLGWKLPADFPVISLRMIGDGQNVRTSGELNFAEPFPPLENWRIPLNLTSEPLTGLTAIRSVPILLQRLGILSAKEAARFPDQFLLWLRSGPPLQIHFAFPSPDATSAFRRIAPPIKDWVNSHTDGKIYGTVNIDAKNSELKWTGFSLCAPWMKVGTNNQTQYLQGGFGLLPPGQVRLPTELHNHITEDPSLVYFDWEFTGQTLPQWRYLDDVSRMVFDEAHVSRLRNSRDSMKWMLNNLTNLSHSVTEVHQVRSNQLVLTRKSTLGVNAVELDILINWIEMPDFPRGMSTLWRTNPAPLVLVRQTNSIAVPGQR